jgi:hypothetical protein
MAIAVKNINGTSPKTCGCGSWLNHWQRYGGSPVPSYCSEERCIKKPTVGAHVQKDSYSDRNWYIIPLCDEHNKKTTSLRVVDSTRFVTANVSATCGK